VEREIVAVAVVLGDIDLLGDCDDEAVGDLEGLGEGDRVFEPELDTETEAKADRLTVEDVERESEPAEDSEGVEDLEKELETEIDPEGDLEGEPDTREESVTVVEGD